MREITVLWALRSPCNLGCRYCYFGTIEEDRVAPRLEIGQLSHISRQDVDFETLAAFARTFADSNVKRIIIAGGEPLIWQHTVELIEILRQGGVEVVVATNGLPLKRPELVTRLIELGVHGLSVSLDSTDPVYNDEYRPSRNGKTGWHDVIEGVQAVLTARGAQTFPRVGIYAAITRLNIGEITAMAHFAADLGCDYYVPQPISLSPGHALDEELSLRAEDLAALSTALHDLYANPPNIDIPSDAYAGQFEASVQVGQTGSVSSCFGGRELFFIQPNGSVWACPSQYKISATPTELHRNIRGATAAEVTTSMCANNGCGVFSRDCVSMWPLMDFDRFIVGATQ